MIQLTPQMRILVAVELADFRKGIDGLAKVCREVLQDDPFSGCVFVFRNRQSTALKALVFDGQGFWLAQNGTGKAKWVILGQIESTTVLGTCDRPTSAR